MKKMKKIFALLIAMVMVLGLSTSVFAGSITITPPADATGEITTSYEYYEIMKASINGDKISYYVESPASDTLAGMLDAVTVDGADLFTVTKSADGTRWNITVNKKADNTDYTDSDGAKIAAALNTNAIKTAAVVHNRFAYDSGSGSAIADNLDDGYYLVTSSLGTALVLQTLGDVAIQTKNTYPGTGKTASKTNMEVGDIVTYTVTVTIPATTKVGEIFSVHDTIDEHLALLNSNNQIAAAATDYAIAAVDGDGNPVTLTDGTLKTGETFAKQFTATQDIIDSSSVVLTYKAELLSTAADDTGYVNDAYTNTPSYETVPVTVKVYTFDFELDKNFQGVEGDDASNYSATFKLEDADGNRISFVQTGTKYEKADSNDTNTVNTITINGTDVINVVGLAAETYKLTELTTAEGYNLLTDPIMVTITDTTQDSDTTPSHTVSYTIGEETGTGRVMVLNQSGSVLPSTGGMGTTIFYVVGVILVLIAAVLLVTRRRMNSK